MGRLFTRAARARPLHRPGAMRVPHGAAFVTILAAACASPAGVPGDAAPEPDGGTGRPHCRGEAGALPAWASAPGPAAVRAGCAGQSLEVAALDDGIVRLRHALAGEDPRARPWSELTPPGPAPDAVVAVDGDAVELCAPALAVRIDAACRIEVRDAAGRVLVDDGPGGGLADAGAERVLTRRSPAGARVYGLGERTGRLDRRGRRLVSWNTDAYDPALGGWRPDADPLYLSVPFWIALDGGVAHGVFTDDPRRIELDLAAAHPERLAIHTPARAIDQYVIAGPSIREVVRRFTAMTGRTPLPPRWALGYHQSRWGYAPAARVLEVARGFRDRGIGADALWLDIQHLDGFRSFTWDPHGFGDPEALAAALAADGFRLVAIVDPGLKVDPAWPIYADGRAGGHFLVDAGGAEYQGVAWPGACAFPDVTRPETRAWWAGLVAALAARGVGGIWLDLNEPTTFPEGGGGTTVPDDVVVRGDPDAPATMAEVHNLYANLEARATWDGLRAAAPDRRPFVLSRAGAAGIQRYAAVWTGDAPSTWDALGQTLPMLLGMGLSGVPLVGSDVGGYSGWASPELFARWMAVGAISPLFRGHVTHGVNDQEPWAFGGEVEEIGRRLIAERYRLLPYVYALMAEAEATGAPPLRPLVWEFQDDPATWDLDDQAMLGPHVLVAPVVTPGSTSRPVYLPAGRWIDARSGAAYDGPRTIEVDVTLQALPTFLREGAIVPRYPRDRAIPHAGAAPDDVLELDLHPGATRGELIVRDDAGDGYGDHRAVRYALEGRPDGATLRAEPAGGTWTPPPRTLRVRVRRADAPPLAVRLDGAPVAATDWRWDARELAIWVELRDRPRFTLEIDHDPAAAAPGPPVRVPVEVRLPPDTPPGAIHVASSVDGWAHRPLERVDATLARGELEVPRGAWFRYKYTRGDWATVEKGADCAELPDRYRYGAADDVQVDAVARWRDDGCP